MDEKVVIAIVAAVSALIGGVITSIVSPWVRYKLERNSAEIDRKRQTIADWREMIAELSNQVGEPQEAQILLQRHPIFQSLEPHLSEEARRAAYARNFTAAAGVHIPYPLHVIKNDIMRIEKEWKVAR